MMKGAILALFVILCALVFLPISPAYSQENSSNLDQYTQYFYNRYSKNLDSFGLQYVAPDYGILAPKIPTTPRELMALASYYKFRAMGGGDTAKELIESQIFAGLRYWQNHPKHTFYSFEDSIAAFLMIRLSDEIPDLLTESERTQVLNEITNILPIGIQASETENRAVIAAAHWQYIINYLSQAGYLNDQSKNQYSQLNKSKIDTALAESVNASYWYHEGNNAFISPHYHTVTAFMVMFYAIQTSQAKYTTIANNMYSNIKKISFRNGMVESKWNFRPAGEGAQFYLMQGLLGRYAGDDDYRVYLSYAYGNRFFSNKQQPDQLEYHSTIEGSAPNYHDDYSFSDVAEIGLTVPQLANISLVAKNYLTSPILNSRDPFFQIKNDGRTIMVNNKKNLLGSFGNYSRMYLNVKTNIFDK